MSTIFQKIPEIMSEIGFISKDRKNTQQGYQFRGIDDVYLALQGPLAKAGVFFSTKVIDQKREEKPSKSGGILIYTILTVKFTFYAQDGSNFSSTTVGEAMDSGDKSSNKAMSTALKYAMLQLFCIPTEGDNDTENHSPEPTSKTIGIDLSAQQQYATVNSVQGIQNKTAQQAIDNGRLNIKQPDPFDFNGPTTIRSK